ncbi:hypothetical protein [Paraclostridium bifermentans]|uniref:hypothetical protein n=1 Tax=Paraclostridium bifermentans TaxID=1490 RepID=UPI00359C7538
MKIVTCTGYYGTGSSAITDLLSEFENIHSMGDYEFRFVQDPEGISDLEYNLVENHHRHNSGHALKRYSRYVDFLSGNKFNKKYENYFDGKFKKISKEYIDELTDFKYKGIWHQDVIDKGKIFYFVERSLNKIYMILRKAIFRKTEKGITLLKNEVTLYSKPGDEFYDITKEYIDKLFSQANYLNKEYIMVDQLVPPTNINRYLRYFNDINVIAVDRDPRDIYILEKLYWKGTIVPCDNAEIFCKWYKYTRESSTYKTEDRNKIMRIKFEDLVYDYENATSKVFEFLGLDPKYHTKKKELFNPDKSINNTRLWLKHDELKKDIEYIEANLSEYLYK